MTPEDGDSADARQDGDDSDGYTHTPGGVDEDRGAVHTPGDTTTDGSVHTPGEQSDDAAEDARGYVHTPEGVEQKGESPSDTAGTTAQPSNTTATTRQAVGLDGEQDVVHPDAVEREFDWRGWVLVAVLFVAFVVAPLTIYLVPPGGEYYFTVLIVMPLVPAILLALVAVWATTRP